MKALVKYGKGKGLVEIREVEKPIIKNDEVLIEVKAVAICGSDLHIFEDEHPYWPPVTMGHEFSGIIAEKGSEVSKWQVGQKVVSETRTKSCGLCRNCQSGSPQICVEKRALGIGVNGAMAKYVAVPAKLLHRMPENISFEEAACMEPFAVCIHAIIERTKIYPGETVIITGPGPIGLICLLLAKVVNAGKIIVTGLSRSASKLEKAKELGADYIIFSDKEDVLKKIEEITKGEGADLLIETSGAAPAIEQSFPLIRRHGRMACLGINGKPTTPVQWDKGIFKGLQLTFCFSSSWTSWETGINLLEAGKLSLEPLITLREPLENWEKVFSLLKSKQAIKAVLYP